MPSPTISGLSGSIYQYYGLPRRQNPRIHPLQLKRFVPKELRQIEHFLHREMGEEYYWDVEGGCNCGDCPKVSQYVNAAAALADSKTYQKFKDMANKYDLHITIERDTGRIWAAKKGISSGKVSSVAKRRQGANNQVHGE